MVGIVVGAIAGTLSLVALIMATLAFLRPSEANKELESAFARLEDDFHHLEQITKSDLGRISRLRRGTLSSQVDTTSPAPDTVPGDAKANGAGEAPSPPMSRNRLLALAKKKGAFSSGEITVSASPDVG